MMPGMLHPAQLPLPAHRLAPGNIDGYTGLVLASLFNELLNRLGIAPTAAQWQAMRARSGMHARHGTPFQGDAPLPAASSLPGIAERIQAAYEALEALRSAK